MNRTITKTFTSHSAEDNFLNETLFHNANGYLGVRGALSEGTPDGWNTMRGTYVNGFYDIIPMRQAENLCNLVNEKETMLNVPDTMTIRSFLDGKAVDMSTGRIIEHRRTLDMDRGVTVRELRWESPEGKQIELLETRMTSFGERSLFTVEYSLKALNFCGTLEIRSCHITDVTNYSDPGDPRMAAESRKNLRLLALETADDMSIAVSETFASHLKLCSAVSEETDQTECSGGFTKTLRTEGSSAVCVISGELKKGEKIVLRKFCVYTDSIREKDVKAAAVRKLQTARAKGLSYYYRAQEKFLGEFWSRSAMEIEGDEALNRAILFNMYELLQSAPVDGVCSIAAKGMSGEGYEGHYFWDTETFILPFFTMTQPEIAKKILEYRYSTLPKAHENARFLGHRKGALFPWRTITGTECSGYFVSGSAAYHIDADIAYAVVKYYQTTGDLEFIGEKGEEILLETARLFMDTGSFDREGHFVINAVTGPDEYTCMVNNNYYTNCAAKYNLEWAVKLYRLLQSEGKAGALTEKLRVSGDELAEMEHAAAAMLLPYDEELGINIQDDSFLQKPLWDFENTPKENYPLLLHYHPLHLYRYQVCKQADTVLAYAMFEDEQPIDVMRRSFRYYEKITTHDSSLSTCVFSIVASKLGFRDEAYRYFGGSAKMDLENTHLNSEFGVHTANMGGCYMAIVNGFAGVYIGKDGFRMAPELPEAWTGLSFNQVFRGSLLHIAVTREGTEVSLREGPDAEIEVYGKKISLKAGESTFCRRIL